MRGLLADANIAGLIDILAALMQTEPWKLFWDHLGLRYVHFDDVGLVPSSPDSVIWQTCQDQGLFLLTDNRNKDDADSLEATIQDFNKPHSLPVFTIGDVQRLRRSKEYANRVIEFLFRYLLEEENILGTGRLFLP